MPPLPLTKVQIEFDLLPERRAVEARCTVKTSGVTGVEMEALTGVSTALLTIYDMCKAVDKGMELGEIHLVAKDRRQERTLHPGGGRLCLIPKGRNIHYLRLSVTDLCNLRCRYCMPDGVDKLERGGYPDLRGIPAPCRPVCPVRGGYRAGHRRRTAGAQGRGAAGQGAESHPRHPEGSP